MIKYKHLLQTKHSSSLAGWTEVALFATLFVLLFCMLMVNMNVQYGKTYDETGFGLDILASGTKGQLSAYQDTLQQNVNTGTASSTGLGISLTTTWGIITAGATIMWNFLTGGWIEAICTNLLSLPAIVGVIMRILFVLSIGFIILKLILKVKP